MKTTVLCQYIAGRFEAGEGWTCAADGEAGATRLDGRTWTYDFTGGAQTLRLEARPLSLPGRPREIILKMRGCN